MLDVFRVERGAIMKRKGILMLLLVVITLFEVALRVVKQYEGDRKVISRPQRSQKIKCSWEPSRELLRLPYHDLP